MKQKMIIQDRMTSTEHVVMMLRKQIYPKEQPRMKKSKSQYSTQKRQTGIHGAS